MTTTMDMSVGDAARVLIKSIKILITGQRKDGGETVAVDNTGGTTMSIGKGIIRIYDLSGKEVYVGPLQFSKQDPEDPNKKILNIGRRGDIQIKKQWDGSIYIGREEAYITLDKDTGEMELWDNNSKNKIWDSEDEEVLTLPVKIENGTTVYFGGVMKAEFQILPNREMVKVLREATLVRRGRIRAKESQCIQSNTSNIDSNPVRVDVISDKGRTHKYVDRPIARVE